MANSENEFRLENTPQEAYDAFVEELGRATTERLEENAREAKRRLQAKSDALMQLHGLEPRSNKMSMLDPNEWNLPDSQEPYALKDGTEARLRIIEVRKDAREDETEYLTVRMEITDEPYSKEVAAFLNLPTNKMDQKQLNLARFEMRVFCQAMEIDISRPFDPTEDWLNLEGWAILGVRKTDRYGEQNVIKKWIVPK